MTALAHHAETGALHAALSLADRVARVHALRALAAAGSPTADSTVLAPLPADARLRREFASEVEWRSDAAVKYTAIVGTAHPAYAGRSWSDLLVNGRRMFDNLAWLIDNPGYYLAGRKAPTMSYVSFDSGATFYIDTDGNHRSCIGRFLGATDAIDGVEITVCRLTPERERLLAAYVRASAALARRGRPRGFFHIDIRGHDRVDGDGWKIDRYRLCVWHLGTGCQRAIEDAGEMEALAAELEAPHRRWWRFWP